MPGSTINRDANNFPYLDVDNYMAIWPEYTQALADFFDQITDPPADLVARFVDSGWVTTGFALQGSASALGEARIRRIGDMVTVYASFTTPLNVPLDGNCANTAVLKVPTGFEPAFSQALGTGSTGRNSAFHITSAGVINLDATTPSATQTGTVAITESFSVGGTYLIG